MSNPTGKTQSQSHHHPKDFILVGRKTYQRDNEIVEKKFYECWNNLTGECRMIQGYEMMNWFLDVAGSHDIGHVRARFTIIPIHEDSRN